MEIVDFSRYKKFNRQIKYSFQGYFNTKFYEDVLFNDYVWKLKYNPAYRYECYSEYIGSHIFAILGMPSQDTMLGICKYGDVNIPVVACKDFTTERFLKFSELADLTGRLLKEGQKPLVYNELEEVVFLIENQNIIDSKLFLTYFYKMIFIDIYISNPDRIWENFGIFVKENEQVGLAPVFDNGDCLYSMELDHNVNFVNDILKKIKFGEYTPSKNQFGIENILFRLNTLKDSVLMETLCYVVDMIWSNKQTIEEMINDISLISNQDKMIYKILLEENLRFLYLLNKESKVRQIL